MFAFDRSVVMLFRRRPARVSWRVSCAIWFFSGFEVSFHFGNSKFSSHCSYLAKTDMAAFAQVSSAV